MNTENQAGALLRQWLETASGYDFVQRFIRCKISPGNPASHHTFLATYLHLDESSSPETFLEEIAHDFLLFLLTFATTKLSGQPVLLTQLYAGKYRYFLDLLWQRYLWNIKDKSRVKKDNPRGYLYRRFREIVGTEPGFSTCVNTAGHLFYCLGGNKENETAEPVKSQPVNILLEETYRDYPMVTVPLHPDAQGDFRLTGQWLTTTATFFYSLVKKRYPQQQYVAVSELIRYLAVVMPWLNNLSRAETDHNADQQSLNQNINSSDNPIDRLAAPGGDDDTRIDRLRQVRTICPLAGQIVSCWDRVQCCVFAWRLEEPPLTLKSIAEKLSLHNHNEAYGLFKKTQKSLKTFCGNWPGPPLHDLEPGVAEVFVNKVVQQAKKKCDGP